MPAKAPMVSPAARRLLKSLGQRILARRKALGVSATAAAESAALSRVTWHRIEQGLPSVAAGAYAAALAALGLGWDAVSDGQSSGPKPHTSTDWIPARVQLDDYPELKRLAWQVHGVDALSPAEALSIYERNWRHVDEKRMPEHERDLVNALRAAFADAQDV